jgi:hypothetical protein
VKAGVAKLQGLKANIAHGSQLPNGKRSDKSRRPDRRVFFASSKKQNGSGKYALEPFLISIERFGQKKLEPFF